MTVWIYISQLAEPLLAMGMCTLMIGALVAFFVHAPSHSGASDGLEIGKRAYRRLFMAGTLMLLAGLFIPTRETLLFIAAAEYGPAALDAIIARIEAVQ